MVTIVSRFSDKRRDLGLPLGSCSLPTKPQFFSNLITFWGEKACSLTTRSIDTIKGTISQFYFGLLRISEFLPMLLDGNSSEEGPGQVKLIISWEVT